MAEQSTTDIPTGGPAPDSVERVRALLSQFVRTLLAFKLYAPANQLRQDMFAELVRRAEALFEMEELVVLEIQEHRLVWLGEPVLDLSDHEGHFVFNLYKDGAREIGFSRGLDASELNRLLELLQVRQVGLADTHSSVDALWEADLPHVIHLAVDGFTELLADEEREGGRVSGLASRFESLLTGLVGEARAEPGELETRRAEFEEPAAAAPAPEETLIRVSETLASPLRNLLEAPGAADDAALADWVEAASESREEELLAIVEELLLYWLEHRASPFADDDFVALLSRLARQWMARGSFAVADDLLTRVGHMRYELPERAAVAEAVLAESGGRALRDLVGFEGLEEAVWDVGEAVRFFERHMAVGDDELLELLELDLGVKGRLLLAQMLTQRVAERPSFWSERFRSLAAPVLALSLASLATIYSEQPNVLEVFLRALEHPDAAVRLASVRCCPALFEDDFRERLLTLLESPELELRCAAIDRLGESGEGSLGAFLINRARRVGLAELDPEEAGALARAILRIGPNRYTPFLRGQLEQLGLDRGREPKEASEQVRAVLGALAAARATAPIELFREVRLRAKGSFRDWCDELWRTVAADWLTTVGATPEYAESAPPQADPEPMAEPPESYELPPPIDENPALAGFGELPEEAADDWEIEDDLVVILDESEP